MKTPLIATIGLLGILLTGCGQSGSNQSSTESSSSSRSSTKVATSSNAQKVPLTMTDAVNKMKSENSDAKLTGIELKNDAGGFVYEINSVTATKELETKINAKSGKVTRNDSEQLENDDKAEAKADGFDISDILSVNAAVKKARNADAKGTLIEYNLEKADTGNLIYELKFDTGDVNKEIGIDATSGKVTQQLQTDD